MAMETLRQSGAGSLFSCSSSDIPCHHFCLRHSKPLQAEDEEWFMTDEIEEVPEEEEEEDMEQDEEAARAGLLDQLLDDAYAQYYEEPDEWEELATWYSSHMDRGETEDSERQPSQSTGETTSEPREDFHPAWRQDPVGTPRREESTTSTSQGRTTRSSAARESSSASASTSHSHRSQPSSSGSQNRHPKERSWDELIADQERGEAAAEIATRNSRGRNSSNWSEPTVVRELELYDAFNDLFFPDPESGRL
ncbi:uncharacterized protein [Asterias amurensis]|uniref:uncharacterized protein n=1 Tax=Asterias amurensis TaxID=7602 RepID=UPI003AB672A2